MSGMRRHLVSDEMDTVKTVPHILYTHIHMSYIAQRQGNWGRITLYGQRDLYQNRTDKYVCVIITAEIRHTHTQTRIHTQHRQLHLHKLCLLSSRAERSKYITHTINTHQRSSHASIIPCMSKKNFPNVI